MEHSWIKKTLLRILIFINVKFKQFNKKLYLVKYTTKSCLSYLAKIKIWLKLVRTILKKKGILFVLYKNNSKIY